MLGGRSAAPGAETTRSDSRVGHLDDVAGTQLAAAAPFGLAVDRDGERADQVLRLAAGVDDAGELQQLAEGDELACDFDVAHLGSYGCAGTMAPGRRRCGSCACASEGS